MRTLSLADLAIYAMVAAAVSVSVAQLVLILNRVEDRSQCYAAPCEGGVRIFADDHCFCVLTGGSK